MKKIFSSLLILFVLSASGQNVSQFKDVPASNVVNELSYINGNKYQKDALLFMDMLASTHPYYIKADKREVLLSRLDGLLAECAVCKTDSEFVKLLRAAMVEVRDKHTEVIDAESLPRFDKLLDEMFASMEGNLSEDKAFMADLERNLDFVEQAKQRNDSRAEKSRRLLLKVLLSGVLVSVSIVILSLLFDAVTVYKCLYALTAACLSSILLLVSSYFQYWKM